jgi:hypothetical protein
MIDLTNLIWYTYKGKAGAGRSAFSGKASGARVYARRVLRPAQSAQFLDTQEVSMKRNAGFAGKSQTIVYAKAPSGVFVSIPAESQGRNPDKARKLVNPAPTLLSRKEP